MWFADSESVRRLRRDVVTSPQEVYEDLSAAGPRTLATALRENSSLDRRGAQALAETVAMAAHGSPEPTVLRELLLEFDERGVFTCRGSDLVSLRTVELLAETRPELVAPFTDQLCTLLEDCTGPDHILHRRRALGSLIRTFASGAVASTEVDPLGILLHRFRAADDGFECSQAAVAIQHLFISRQMQQADLKDNAGRVVASISDLDSQMSSNSDLYHRLRLLESVARVAPDVLAPISDQIRALEGEPDETAVRQCASRILRLIGAEPSPPTESTDPSPKNRTNVPIPAGLSEKHGITADHETTDIETFVGDLLDEQDRDSVLAMLREPEFWVTIDESVNRGERESEDPTEVADLTVLPSVGENLARRLEERLGGENDVVTARDVQNAEPEQIKIRDVSKSRYYEIKRGGVQRGLESLLESVMWSPQSESISRGDVADIVGVAADVNRGAARRAIDSAVAEAFDQDSEFSAGTGAEELLRICELLEMLAENEPVLLEHVSDGVWHGDEPRSEVWEQIADSDHPDRQKRALQVVCHVVMLPQITEIPDRNEASRHRVSLISKVVRERCSISEIKPSLCGLLDREPSPMAEQIAESLDCSALESSPMSKCSGEID